MPEWREEERRGKMRRKKKLKVVALMKWDIT